METKTSGINTNKDVSVLEKYIQVISVDLMDALKDAATERGVSLDMEIAARLTAYMAEPELAQDNSLSQQILRMDFTEEQAVAECKYKRESALYLYEIERLRLYLRFERQLPRNFKEEFQLIDVKALTPRIRAEIEAEDKKNQANQ